VLRHHFSRRVGTTPNDYRRTFCGRREVRSA
jgi:transcriptional regulator GlxA family with amidase domain